MTDPRLRTVTADERAVIIDLTSAATENAMRGADTQMRLTLESVGPSAAGAVAMRVSYAFITWAATMLAGERALDRGHALEHVHVQKDDLLFCALLSVAEGDTANAVKTAKAWFKKITDRDADLPETWDAATEGEKS